MKISDAQMRELEKLARDPRAHVGSCTNMTMRSLMRKGLVRIEWVKLPDGLCSRSKWIITATGRALVDERDAARRKLREILK